MFGCCRRCAKPEKEFQCRPGLQYRGGQPPLHYRLRLATCVARSETILASLSSTVLASAPYSNRREDALIWPTEAPSSRTESSPLLVIADFSEEPADLPRRWDVPIHFRRRNADIRRPSRKTRRLALHGQLPDF